MHLGWSNDGHRYIQGDAQLESSSAKGDLGMLVDSRLSMSQQHALVAKRAKRILGCIKHSMSSWSKEVILLPYLSLVWPHLEYCVQFWASKYKQDVKVLECIQRSATVLVKGLKGMSCEEKPSTRGLSGLEKVTQRQPHCSLQLPEGGSYEGGASLCSVGADDSMCRNGTEMHQRSVSSDWTLGKKSLI